MLSWAERFIILRSMGGRKPPGVKCCGIGEEMEEGFQTMEEAPKERSQRIDLKLVWNARDSSEPGHAESLSKLKESLKAGASPNHSHKKHKTPLGYACEIGAREAAQALIDAGALVSGRALDGGTPMMDAAKSGQAKMIELLVECGAWAGEGWMADCGEGRAASVGVTALHIAAGSGNADCVAALMAAGASPLAKIASNNMTPADIAKHNGHEEIADLISWTAAKLEGEEIAKQITRAQSAGLGKARL